MKTAFRYNRVGAGSVRPPCGYGRWLGFWLRALARALWPGSSGLRLLWAEDRAAETLAAGFPALLAVPGELFARTAELFPARCRLAAEGKGEEELLAAIRELERRCDARFDWDAFLAACERQNRRAARLGALAEAVRALAPRGLDTRSPLAALRSLLETESGKE